MRETIYYCNTCETASTAQKGPVHCEKCGRQAVETGSIEKKEAYKRVEQYPETD